MAHRLCAGIGVWCGGASKGMAGQGMLPLLQTRPVESRNHLRTRESGFIIRRRDEAIHQ